MTQQRWSWRGYVREQLPPLNVPAERELEIIEELAVQLESTYDRARENGAGEDEARRLAIGEVPDWNAFARTVAAVERRPAPPATTGAPSGGVMTGITQDVRYALRGLMRAPGFAAVSIVTLALGIAATTIVYSIVDGILLRPLPIKDADRVVMAREFINGAENSVSWPSYLDWQQRQTSFSHIAAWRGINTNLTGFGEARRLNARQMTWPMLATLGVTPWLGRDFTADDDRPGVGRTALVSHRFWQRELGGDASAIGRTITLDDTPVTVIGVLPPDFTIARDEDVFLPFQNFISGSARGMLLNRGNHFGLAAIGRLRDGVSLDTARAEIVGIARQLELEYPATNSGNSAVVRPLLDVLVADARPMLYALLGAVGAMLLIACVNLANLALARAAGRSQEMAVRRSLGAHRGRIVRQMLTESLLLAAIGGVAGVALAYAGFEALVALLPPSQPRIHIVEINGRVLTVAALASIGTGLLFGVMPALQAAAGRSVALLKSARVTGDSQVPATQRRALLIAEVGLAVVLVTGAGLMLQTMRNLLSIDTGFTREQIVTATMQLPDRYDQPRRRLLVTQVIDKLRASPGVIEAAFTNSIPIAGSNWGSIFVIDGQPVPERSKLPSAAWTTVTDRYFDTMGIRLVRGRLFAAADADTAPRVAVVNQTFARRFFGDNNPIGARVKQGWPEDNAPWREIVGVVNDVRVNGLQDDSRLQVYLPFVQTPMPFGSVVARANGDAAAIVKSIESAVRGVDPNLPLFNVRTMEQIVDADVGNARLTMVLLIGFAALALLIAAIGVFGVTAYSVAQRTHELGIRMALGADRGNVLGLVLRQEMSACLAGIGLGIIGAFFMTSLLESLLYRVASRDALTMSIAAVVLLAVTIVACLIPAVRATQVDPVTALRID
jgi:putative ABC transport system permease protein